MFFRTEKNYLFEKNEGKINYYTSNFFKNRNYLFDKKLSKK